MFLIHESPLKHSDADSAAEDSHGQKNVQQLHSRWETVGMGPPTIGTPPRPPCQDVSNRNSLFSSHNT